MALYTQLKKHEVKQDKWTKTQIIRYRSTYGTWSNRIVSRKRTHMANSRFQIRHIY